MKENDVIHINLTIRRDELETSGRRRDDNWSMTNEQWDTMTSGVDENGYDYWNEETKAWVHREVRRRVNEMNMIDSTIEMRKKFNMI